MYINRRSIYRNTQFYLLKIWRVICNKPAESASDISWSLDYYIMDELKRGLERLIPYQEKNHVQDEETKKEKQELLQLVQSYSKGNMDWFAVGTQQEDLKITKKSLEKREKIINKELDRLFYLLRKHFRSLRY